MKKSELIDAIAQHANLSKADAGRALDGLTKTIETTLKAGDSGTLVGFGTFEAKARADVPVATRKPDKPLPLPPRQYRHSKPAKP